MIEWSANRKKKRPGFQEGGMAEQGERASGRQGKKRRRRRREDWDRKMNDSPVMTPDAVPFASTGHPAVLGIWLGEELAGEGDNGLCRVSMRDPGAFGAGGCVVDDGAAAVGCGGSCAGALLGELLRLAICVPGERVGLVV